VIVEEDDVVDGAIGNENGDDTDHTDDGNQADGHTLETTKRAILEDCSTLDFTLVDT